MASVIEFSPSALFALNFATPNKFAVALLIFHNNLSFEAPAAAEVVAAVSVLALRVAPPPTGAQDPSLRIVRAVVWAGLDVDEGPLAHRQLGGGQLHTTSVPP